MTRIAAGPLAGQPPHVLAAIQGSRNPVLISAIVVFLVLIVAFWVARQIRRR
jgi:hypothetical protein